MNVATSSSDSNTISGVTAKITISGATTVLQVAGAHALQPAHTLFRRSDDSSRPRTHSSDGVPIEVAQPQRQRHHDDERQEGQRDHARVQAVGDRAPERIEKQSQWAPRFSRSIARNRSSPLPNRRLSPSHCCDQKPRP